MDSWIGIILKEVGGGSASGGLEAEGQEFFALASAQRSSSGALLKQKEHSLRF